MWQVAVLVAAIAASVAAVWVALSADFLTYPGWLAVQKADFILGPVLAGLYWYRRRPQSRFGPMLIAFGLVVDDGLGFAVGEVRGIGLQNMADRLGALGGRLTIATAPGRGTTISGHVPLRSATPEP